MARSTKRKQPPPKDCSVDPNWPAIRRELKKFKRVHALGSLALDTLYGSMWSRGHQYTTLSEAMAIDNAGILAHSLHRLGHLAQEPNISYRERSMAPCAIGVGTYGWKYNHDIIHKAVEMSVPLIDTAEGYGYGRVEFELGYAMRDVGLVPIATKVRRDHMKRGPLRNAMQRSIEKLGSIPHAQIHFPNQKYPDAFLDLAELRRDGIVLSVGLGNCSVDMIEYAQRVLSDTYGDPIRSVQMRFSLIDQRIKNALLPYCQERGILVIAYSPLGQKFKQILTPTLKSMAKKYNATSAQVALSWILSHPGVMPIPRTNNLKHLCENLEASELILNHEDIEELGCSYLRGDF